MYWCNKCLLSNIPDSTFRRSASCVGHDDVFRSNNHSFKSETDFLHDLQVNILPNNTYRYSRRIFKYEKTNQY